MSSNIGEKITDFTLKNHLGEEISLSRLKGKKVLLSFHPLAWTSICAQQMKSLEDNFNTFTELNTVALGVSVDTVPSKKAWAEELGIKNTSLLADFWPHGQLAQQLGIFNGDGGYSERTNIILDEQGQVIFKKIYPISNLPDIKEIIDFLTSKP